MKVLDRRLSRIPQPWRSSVDWSVTVLRSVASPFVVFERDEVSSVVGSLPVRVASEAGTAGA